MRPNSTQGGDNANSSSVAQRTHVLSDDDRQLRVLAGGVGVGGGDARLEAREELRELLASLACDRSACCSGGRLGHEQRPAATALSDNN